MIRQNPLSMVQRNLNLQCSNIQKELQSITVLFKSLLQEFSHELVDLLWSVVLHKVTAVSNVPTERKEGEGERRDSA
jgi:hypothetical protein